ncbi:shikimate kinase [Hyphococcus luteus]|uniref:Shikimate kinase n=1 Tax=Hyphococcus luteus TaxID=2058213 RepID=A0A2S7K959_9PROT|nr:shikimate kinase [Marinicaulis flavus]PQA88989.1 shikimate kinase [Marinicaulis flavus]
MGQSRKHPELECARSVVLVGMMGAGKTTVGRRLAPRLGLPFYDADQEIEKASGMSVSDLFAAHGEKSFREGEARVIRRLLEGPPHVLATGGGAVTHPETRELIKKRAVSVWIEADLDTIVARATKRNTRPLLQAGDPRETLERLIEERRPYYEAADIHVESQSGPHSHTVDLIMNALEARPDLLTAVEENAQ